MKITAKRTTKRENKNIYIPFTEDDYKKKIEISDHFRKYIDNQTIFSWFYRSCKSWDGSFSLIC